MKRGKLYNHLVYLAGPIENVEDNGIGWRKEITPFLHSFGIGVLDPCALKEDDSIKNKTKELRKLGLEADSRGQLDLSRSYAYQIHNLVRDIVAWDLNAVDLSSFIICYIDTDVHMAGSYCELSHACLQRKPCIVIVKQGRWNLPGWWWGQLDFNLVCNNFDEAKKLITDINNNNINPGKRWQFLDMDRVYKHD